LPQTGNSQNQLRHVRILKGQIKYGSSKAKGPFYMRSYIELVFIHTKIHFSHVQIILSSDDLPLNLPFFVFFGFRKFTGVLPLPLLSSHSTTWAHPVRNFSSKNFSAHDFWN
jgi:hypothetical protein